MSSQRRRILNRIALGCGIAAALSLLTIPLVPDSMLPLAMRWSPWATLALLILAGLLARVASWQPTTRPVPQRPPARQMVALTAVPTTEYRNDRRALPVRAGYRRNDRPAVDRPVRNLPAVDRPVRAALTAAPERVV